MTLDEILSDPNLPSLYDKASRFERYFRVAGRPELLAVEEYRPDAIFSISESSPHLFHRRQTYSISIDFSGLSNVPKLTFLEARQLAIQLLPKEPPIKAEYVGTYPHDALEFDLQNEQAYLVATNEDTKVFYSAQFASKQNAPTFDGKEGNSPYHEAIQIHISESGVMGIVVGGLPYFPPRLQKSEKLDINQLIDKSKLNEIIRSWQADLSSK